ncbi:adenosine deaminase [soil metagenome]
MLSPELERLIHDVPKVELHLHIEGTLEPEMVFALAAKHRVEVPHASVEALRAAYDFHDLQSFLDLYYAGCDVLRDREDFFVMARAYFDRAQKDGLVHSEIFFDPQSHTTRGVSMETIVGGLHDAIADASARHGITASLIMCFLRHLSEDDARATLEAAVPFRDKILGVGLDSGERGNPPAKFARVFAEARAMGLRLVAHAGEEGPAANVCDALDLLHAERIDHGVRSDEDPELVSRLVRERIPLTVCPLSNLKLRVVDDLAAHNLKRMLDLGVVITINSDDPAYFGGYIEDNYRQVAAALRLSAADVRTLAANAIRASFLGDARKAELLQRIPQ